MNPKTLHQSRPEYSVYPLGVFRDHIYQEECLQNFIAQRRARIVKYDRINLNSFDLLFVLLILSCFVDQTSQCDRNWSILSIYPVCLSKLLTGVNSLFS
jgi:hypothetical protein